MPGRVIPGILLQHGRSKANSTSPAAEFRKRTKTGRYMTLRKRLFLWMTHHGVHGQSFPHFLLQKKWKPLHFCRSVRTLRPNLVAEGHVTGPEKRCSGGAHKMDFRIPSKNIVGSTTSEPYQFDLVDPILRIRRISPMPPCLL